MNKNEILKVSLQAMTLRRKYYVDVAWFIEEDFDEQLETQIVLQQLERDGKIKVTDRSAYNIISCFLLT
ncbi:hypothetical protein [Atlantibacter hermannii]|uniref:hypothetical protein n=1 Tax=Atlantibacter hermannii TaxID=565 RepID=UPI0028AF31FA|nr:hypothetical protein [Atlantibacter hermannii]